MRLVVEIFSMLGFEGNIFNCLRINTILFDLKGVVLAIIKQKNKEFEQHHFYIILHS